MGRCGDANAKKPLYVVLADALTLQSLGAVSAGIMHAVASAEVGRWSFAACAHASQGGHHDGALVHIGFSDSVAGPGQKVGSPDANRGNGRVQAVAFGLLLGRMPRNLPHSAAHQVEIELRFCALGVHLVAADQQFAVGAQCNARLVGKNQDHHGILAGDNAVLL